MRPNDQKEEDWAEQSSHHVELAITGNITAPYMGYSVPSANDDALKFFGQF
jgi:hypothetical protein